VVVTLGGNSFGFRSDDGLLGQKAADGLRDLSSLGCPVVDAIALEFDAGGVGAGIVSTNHLDRTAIAGAVLLDDNDAVMGLLTGANARQTDHQHRGISSQTAIFVLRDDAATWNNDYRRPKYTRTPKYLGFSGVLQ
jgi:hypothetical protein